MFGGGDAHRSCVEHSETSHVMASRLALWALAVERPDIPMMMEHHNNTTMVRDVAAIVSRFVFMVGSYEACC